jgi:type VI secretion system protein ImpH
VLDDLFKAPWKWDFFQALRQIECEYSHTARVGVSTTLRDDPVRFGQFISLAFAASTLEQPHPESARAKEAALESQFGPQKPTIRYVPSGCRKCIDTLLPSPPEKMLVRFTGLTGPNGPLPMVLTELIRNRLTGVDDPDLPRTVFGENADQPQASRRDPGLADFIDIFHHRLISLFYRAWALANKTVDFDRHDLPGERNYFSEWIASLFGNGLPEYDGLDGIPSWQKLAFAGHLAAPTRHLSGLRGILSTVFSTRSEVEALVGHWVRIPDRERCRLGRSRRTGVMGSTCIVGSRFWDRQQKIAIVLGPMPYEEFQSFLPGGKCHRLLHEWIAFYTRREFFWEARIVLQREEVPPFRLRAGRRGVQLGRNAWLRHRSMNYDPSNYRIKGGEIRMSEAT